MRCGGLVFALRLNHTMCDAAGIMQFMRAVGELDCGLPELTVAPVWSREILDARSPPRPLFAHHEYDPVPPPSSFPPPGDDMVMRTFPFGPDYVAAIKKGLSAAQRGGGTLGDAVELVREAKRLVVSAEYVRSMADLMALRQRPSLAMGNMLIVSDNRHAGFRHVDFGWGEPVYGGPASALERVELHRRRHEQRR